MKQYANKRREVMDMNISGSETPSGFDGCAGVYWEHRRDRNRKNGKKKIPKQGTEVREPLAGRILESKQDSFVNHVHN